MIAAIYTTVNNLNLIKWLALNCIWAYSISTFECTIIVSSFIQGNLAHTQIRVSSIHSVLYKILWNYNRQQLCRIVSKTHTKMRAEMDRTVILSQMRIHFDSRWDLSVSTLIEHPFSFSHYAVYSPSVTTSQFYMEIHPGSVPQPGLSKSSWLHAVSRHNSFTLTCCAGLSHNWRALAKASRSQGESL